MIFLFVDFLCLNDWWDDNWILSNVVFLISKIEIRHEQFRIRFILFYWKMIYSSGFIRFDGRKIFLISSKEKMKRKKAATNF